MTTKKKDICCPHCGKKDTWKKDNEFRPFCCARCKLIDLGEWASDKRAIPGESVTLNDQEFGETDEENNK